MTVSYDLWPGHPREQEVRELLASMRNRLTTLWHEIEDYNRAERKEVTYKVTVYCGAVPGRGGGGRLSVHALPRRGWLLPGVALLLVAGCDATRGPRAGGLTNWLRVCESDADCGDLRCLCGAGTLPCGAEGECAGLDGTTCIDAEESCAIALCSGEAPTSPGLCLTRCEDDDCGRGAACVAGVCTPLPEPTARVTVDATRTYQTLLGLGRASPT
jgi:hypothetical protein